MRGGNFDRDVLASEVPVVPMRRRLRPCCAFGAGLQTRLGSMPVPGLKLKNILSVEDLGPHVYDSGLLVAQSSRGEILSAENNGLVYTCRAGFIDTAHVRDYADWMLFMASAIARSLETGAVIELPPEGGQRRVVLEPVDPEILERHGRKNLTVPLAEWLTFKFSVWHEIATWYGWAALSLFPEYASAFSPEDLYSNALGIKLTTAAIETDSAGTDLLYDEAIDGLTRGALELLGATSERQGVRAMGLVDGVWWDSSKRLPAKELVLRRDMDIDRIEPWRVSQAYDSEQMRAWQAESCENEKPVPLTVADGLPGLDFSSIVRLEIEVAVPDPFPFPDPESRVITQADFPYLMEQIRRQNEEEFGPGADRPELAAGEGVLGE